MADSALIQQVECRNRTGSNADTEEGRNHRWYTIFSSMDLMDGFYQILMRERDIPYTAVSTPSGMLWE